MADKFVQDLFNHAKSLKIFVDMALGAEPSYEEDIKKGKIANELIAYYAIGRHSLLGDAIDRSIDTFGKSNHRNSIRAKVIIKMVHKWERNAALRSNRIIDKAEKMIRSMPNGYLIPLNQTASGPSTARNSDLLSRSAA